MITREELIKVLGTQTLQILELQATVRELQAKLADATKEPPQA